MCKVKVKCNTRQKMSKLFIILGNGQASLDMPNINIPNIININGNTIDTEESHRVNNCSPNIAILQGSRHEQHYTKMMQEADRAEKCYTNRDSISNVDNKDKPMVIDEETNTINYCLPGPCQDNDKRASTEITQQLQRDFKDVFTGICCFDGMFLLEEKPDSKPYQELLRHVTYALQKPLKEELE